MTSQSYINTSILPGPLSSGSFMMSLRTRQSLSRESTPEPRNMSDLSSVATEDDIGMFQLAFTLHNV